MKGHAKAISRLTVCLLASAAFVPSAFAQTNPTPPPVFQSIDENGVDLASGRLVFRFFGIEIGPQGPGGLGFNWSTNDQDQRPEVSGYLNPSFSTGNKTTVVLGGQSKTFSFSGSQSSAVYTPDQADGSALQYDVSSDTFSYYTRDGAVAQYQKKYTASGYKIRSLTYPAGQTLRYYYTAYNLVDATGATYQSEYLTSITSSLGYQLRLEWSQYGSAYLLTKTTVFNMANESCLPTASTCNVSTNWPTVSRDPATLVMTDALGRKASFGVNGSGVLTINLPSGRQVNYNVSQDPDYRGVGILSYPSYLVTGYSDGKAGWRYNRTGRQVQGLMERFNPNSPNAEIFNISATGQITGHQKNSANPLSENMQYDANGRVLSKSVTNGSLTSTTTFSYDDRGNVVEQRLRSTSSGSPADIVTRSSYPANCDNRAVCNKPTYTVDANSNRTDYSYTTFGELQSITLPAGSNDVRPSINYGYSRISAMYNGVQGDATWVLSSTSKCKSLSTCAGAADEVKVSVYHDPNNALLPTAVTQSAGDNSVSSTISLSYYPTGDVKTVDGALPGSADTTRYYYDIIRRQIGVIGPDPDGSGPLRYRALRTLYAPDGQVSSVERGTASGQGDGDLSTFSALRSVVSNYDGQGRLSATRSISNGAVYGLTEYSYTLTGKPLCVAIRMNVNTFGSTTDACTSTAVGSDGPDRITRFTYDSLDRSTDVTSGLTSSSQTIESKGYDELGRLAYVADSNNNKTTYSYDGMGRLKSLVFPNSTFEEIGYDANSNIVSRKLRDGQTLTYTYDALNRRIQDHNPRTNVAEVSVDYSYDNFGKLTKAIDGNGWSKTFVYDALGRATQEGSNVSNTSFQYDSAGMMVRQTWADGFYVTYEYNAAAELLAVRENGGTALISLSYDDLGRRKTLARGNGVTTSYSYDSSGRLGGLSFSGSIPNSYTYTYNAANQIVSRTSSNDAYSWSGQPAVDRQYSVNSLNQYTSAGSTNFGYDTRGNLTQSGSDSYQYNTRNQLFMNGSNQLVYRGPSGLLGQTPGINYDWVNGQLAQESSDHVVRRYVYGPGIDEPIVWYEGAGTTDRRWLVADERGSIVAVSNSAGNTSVNAYDDHGIPSPGNQGRFGYTGQIWIPELAMWDFKARMYSPSLGRFMQTDPLGYDDGLNWYSYGKNDPINRKDPSGLASITYQYCLNSGSSLRSDGTNSDIIAPGCREKTIDIQETTQWYGIPMAAVGAATNVGNGILSQTFSRTLDNCPESSFGIFRSAANAAYASNPMRAYHMFFPFSVLRGISIHSEFAGSVNLTGGLYRAEVSYKDGLVVPYSTRGSVRADGVYGPVASPDYVVELKSGMSIPTPSEIEAYRRNLPAGTKVCAIIESR